MDRWLSTLAKRRISSPPVNRVQASVSSDCKIPGVCLLNLKLIPQLPRPHIVVSSSYGSRFLHPLTSLGPRTLNADPSVIYRATGPMVPNEILSRRAHKDYLDQDCVLGLGRAVPSRVYRSPLTGLGNSVLAMLLSVATAACRPISLGRVPSDQQSSHYLQLRHVRGRCCGARHNFRCFLDTQRACRKERRYSDMQQKVSAVPDSLFARLTSTGKQMK